MRLLQLVLLGLIVMLQYRFWFADNGFVDRQRLDAEISTVKAEIEVIEQKNAALEARVFDLKNGTDAIEELARQNLGLIKPGEVFIMTVEPTPQ